MQRINFTESTLNTLKKTANCSFANAVYKLTMKAQQGLKCDDLYKKSVLMNDVNKLLCNYKLDTCISFHPALEGGTNTWTFGLGSFTGTISYYLNIDGVNVFIGAGDSAANIVTDIINNSDGTGVTASLDGSYITITSPVGCFVEEDLTSIKTPAGTIPSTQMVFLASKCAQEETCVDYTEEQLNCITPQDLQVLYEFTHKYKETLAKSTKKISNPSSNTNTSNSSDCCTWGSIGGNIGNQSDLVTYLANIEKNYISVEDEGTEITDDVKSINFTGNVTASDDGNGNVTVNVTGGGGSTYTVNNGLTEDPANNFKLGGTLIEDTTISQDGYLMTFEGNVPNKVDSLVNIDKTGGQGSALAVNSDAIGAVINSTATGIGIVNSSSPISGRGILGSNLSYVDNNPNTQVTILTLVKEITTTSSPNSGVLIAMSPGTTGGNSGIGSSIIGCLVENATAPNIESKLVLQPQGTSSGLYGPTLVAYGSGKLQLSAYGQTPSNFAGSAVYNLGVDASGNVVESTNNIQTFKQVISSADIKNGVAISLLPAPGAGKAITIIEASIKLDGNTPYAGAIGVFGIYASVSGTLSKTLYNSGANTFFNTNSGPSYYKMIDTNTNTGILSPNIFENEGISARVFWSTPPAGAGNVGVTVYGSYRIIDL